MEASESWSDEEPSEAGDAEEVFLGLGAGGGRLVVEGVERCWAAPWGPQKWYSAAEEVAQQPRLVRRLEAVQRR